MRDEGIISLEQFLREPLEQVAQVAPASVIYAPGGTKRSAIYNRIDPWSIEYVEWGLERTLDCLEVIFAHGVKNIFLPVFMSGHIREFGDHQERLFRILAKYLGSPASLAYYRQQDWRVRLIAHCEHPTLSNLKWKLESETNPNAPRGLWFMGSYSIESYWSFLLTSIVEHHSLGRTDAIRHLYGVDVPPITMMVGFGKPVITPEMYPPLLQEEIQCYWSQQVGYSLTERQLRMILYDYAFLRNTWQQDKTARAVEAEADRALWESEFILGLGRRIGPFWYPELQGYPAEHLP